MASLLPNSTEIIDQEIIFSWQDYIIFFVMLIASSAIGLYFGCFSKKQSTVDEYHLGGKEIGIVPIAVSLVSSCISGISIIAIPAEVYAHGALYGLTTLLLPLGIWIAYFVTVPVFMKLQFPSTFEYLGVRFDNKVKLLCSFLYTVSMLLHLPIIIYVPTLALSQSTGLDKNYIPLVLCGVCVFYTTIGGLKAVVWTDAIQFLLMVISICACTYLGTASVGGVGEVTRISSEGGRLHIDYDFDITKRDTIWAGIIGSLFSTFIGISVGQGVIQKYIALPTMAHVKKAVIIFSIGMAVFMALCTFIGFIIYAKYHDCDPLKSSKVSRSDQMVPFLVLDVARNFPGLPGLFIAGVFSAALSTLSGSLNCLSCTIYEDFIANRVPANISQRKVRYILMAIVLFIGILSTALVYVVEKLGGVLDVALSLGGITHGPQLGMFLLGMLVPSSNSKGALYGGIFSTLILTWMVLGRQYYKMKGYFFKEELATSTEGCSTFINSTLSMSPQTTDWQPSTIYRISHYYYVAIGCIIVLIIGPVISRIFKAKDFVVNKDLISPVMYWALPKDKSTSTDGYCSVEQALKVMKRRGSNE